MITRDQLKNQTPREISGGLIVELLVKVTRYRLAIRVPFTNTVTSPLPFFKTTRVDFEVATTDLERFPRTTVTSALRAPVTTTVVPEAGLVTVALGRTLKISTFVSVLDLKVLSSHAVVTTSLVTFVTSRAVAVPAEVAL